MMLIKGSRVLDPESGFDQKADILIEDGRIKEIAEHIEAGGNTQVIDGTGKVAAPGLVDVHIHFRDPGFTYKEDIDSGAKAAAKGGFTTVVCMANTDPKIETPQEVEYVLAKGRKTPVRVLCCGAVSKGFKGEELTDMEQLKKAGAVGFTDDGIPISDEAFLKTAMEEAARLGLPISLHEENPAFIRQNGIHHGEVSKSLGLYGSPALAEDIMVARDAMLALHTGARINIQHISSKTSVAVVRLAKQLGADLWAEVTPHHFTLTDRAVLEYGSLAKMNPPLRTEADRAALIEGLKDGTIDLIATDHAPHSREEKAQPLENAPSGIIGLETSLALGITHLVKPGHLSLMELMRKMSVNPCALYGLPGGRMAAGAPADIVLFAPEETYPVDSFASKSSNSPFLSQSLTGKVKLTVCRGRIAYQDR